MYSSLNDRTFYCSMISWFLIKNLINEQILATIGSSCRLYRHSELRYVPGSENRLRVHGHQPATMWRKRMLLETSLRRCYQRYSLVLFPIGIKSLRKNELFLERRYGIWWCFLESNVSSFLGQHRYTGKRRSLRCSRPLNPRRIILLPLDERWSLDHENISGNQ